jgi:hypothetical protein
LVQVERVEQAPLSPVQTGQVHHSVHCLHLWAAVAASHQVSPNQPAF